jgi:hypothetical protein
MYSCESSCRPRTKCLAIFPIELVSAPITTRPRGFAASERRTKSWYSHVTQKSFANVFRAPPPTNASVFFFQETPRRFVRFGIGEVRGERARVVQALQRGRGETGVPGVGVPGGGLRQTCAMIHERFHSRIVEVRRRRGRRTSTFVIVVVVVVVVLAAQ